MTVLIDLRWLDLLKSSEFSLKRSETPLDGATGRGRAELGLSISLGELKLLSPWLGEYTLGCTLPGVAGKPFEQLMEELQRLEVISFLRWSLHSCILNSRSSLLSLSSLWASVVGATPHVPLSDLMKYLFNKIQTFIFIVWYGGLPQNPKEIYKAFHFYVKCVFEKVWWPTPEPSSRTKGHRHSLKCCHPLTTAMSTHVWLCVILQHSLSRWAHSTPPKLGRLLQWLSVLR